MASLFTHAYAALSGAAVLDGRGDRARLLALSAFASVVPDADVLGFRFGVAYGDLWGHRGLTHSLAFAVLLGLALVRLGFPRERAFTPSWWRLWAWFAAITASHGAFDALTDGGLGVAFLSPFDPTRWFAPWRPVLVSPIGVANFFTAYGARVLRSEVLWIWLPWTLGLGLVAAVRRAVRGRARSAREAPLREPR
ncbi:MAG: metal-dependent hydrolase [Planctomycetes bacterium]|nr:metal-dependent hydrolase [Planctomycetota bacterium]